MVIFMGECETLGVFELELRTCQRPLARKELESLAFDLPNIVSLAPENEKNKTSGVSLQVFYI